MPLFMLKLYDEYKAAKADLTQESKWAFALVLPFNKNWKADQFSREVTFYLACF